MCIIAQYFKKNYDAAYSAEETIISKRNCSVYRLCMCVHACVRVMYVTTTTHKYNSLKNVTIGFLILVNSDKVMFVYSSRKS